MSRKDQKGGVVLVLSDIILAAALIAALIFGGWAYKDRQRYKDQTDDIVAQEVVKAKEAQKDELAAAFAQREKSPYKAFRGSATYGTITFSYPKTWSGYVDETNSSTPINGYFHPGVVPSVNQRGDAATAFGLRLELLNSDYAEVIKRLESSVTDGQLKATAYVPPRMSDTANVQAGTLFEGELDEGLNGAVLVIKVRDKTLQISTQSTNYLGDFNNVILKSLTFIP